MIENNRPIRKMKAKIDKPRARPNMSAKCDKRNIPVHIRKIIRKRPIASLAVILGFIQ